MSRAQLYYPANQIGEVTIAQPGEFIDSITLEPYEGPYVEANGQYIAGSTPRLGDPVLKRIAEEAGEKFRQPISSEYYALTRREFINHTTPTNIQQQPTSEDQEDGEYKRYYAKKRKETFKIYEVDEEQYKQFNRENAIGIDSRIYNKIEIRWMLTGKDAVQNNIINIQLLESRFPGMQKYLSNPNDYVEYQKENIPEYPDGTPIPLKLPAAYGQSPNKNQCLNWAFRHNNYCSKWVAQIRRQYWCASWKQNPKKNILY